MPSTKENNTDNANYMRLQKSLFHVRKTFQLLEHEIGAEVLLHLYNPQAKTNTSHAARWSAEGDLPELKQLQSPKDIKKVVDEQKAHRIRLLRAQAQYEEIENSPFKPKKTPEDRGKSWFATQLHKQEEKLKRDKETFTTEVLAALLNILGHQTVQGREWSRFSVSKYLNNHLLSYLGLRHEDLGLWESNCENVHSAQIQEKTLQTLEAFMCDDADITSTPDAQDLDKYLALYDQHE